jgi:hypothetical protein
MSLRKYVDGKARSADVVQLFKSIDPVYDKNTRRLVTAYLASGVAAPGGGTTDLRTRMPIDLIQAYGLCSPHAVTRSPINLNVHDRLDYARLIRNPYIIRVIQCSVAAYFNKLPLTREILSNLVMNYIKGGLEEGIEIGIKEGWLKLVFENGWPDDMCGMPVRAGDKHLRPTRIGIYRTIEAITWIMDCTARVRATLNNDDMHISCNTFRSRWPHETTTVDGVTANSEWKLLQGT